MKNLVSGSAPEEVVRNQSQRPIAALVAVHTTSRHRSAVPPSRVRPPRLRDRLQTAPAYPTTPSRAGAICGPAVSPPPTLPQFDDVEDRFRSTLEPTMTQ